MSDRLILVYYILGIFLVIISKVEGNNDLPDSLIYSAKMSDVRVSMVASFVRARD